RILAPPPVLFVAALGLGLAVDWLSASNVTAMVPAMPRWIVAAVLAIGGGILGVLGIVDFLRAGTTPHPGHAASALVTSGVYRFVRNPMYVGLVALLLAIGLAVPGDGLVLAAAALGVVLHHGVVRPEERYLERRFGDAYRAYRDAVPRYGWPRHRR
ncbi:MAG: methyltransferase family protein, partial [Pseudomonadota bacterium]